MRITNLEVNLEEGISACELDREKVVTYIRGISLYQLYD